MNMTKADFVKAMAKRAHITQAQAEKDLHNVLDTLVEVTANGYGVKFVGYFSTEIREVAEREFANPQDRSQTVTVAAHNKVAIKAGSLLTDAAFNADISE
jgi:DNA-binding protein HU-beta